MKLKEYMTKVAEMGFVAEHYSSFKTIAVKIKSTKQTILNISNDHVNIINMCTETILDLMRHDPLVNSVRPLCRLSMEFASTPIEERVDPKKYQARLKYDFLNEKLYLNFNIREKIYVLNTDFDSAYYKTKFTKKELEGLDLEGFELVEVEE